MASKYDPETRAKAVRPVLEHRDNYPSEWAAITAVSKRLGMNAETLRNWIRQQQVDDGDRDGVSSSAAADGPPPFAVNGGTDSCQVGHRIPRIGADVRHGRRHSTEISPGAVFHMPPWECTLDGGR